MHTASHSGFRLYAFRCGNRLPPLKTTRFSACRRRLIKKDLRQQRLSLDVLIARSSNWAERILQRSPGCAYRAQEAVKTFHEAGNGPKCQEPVLGASGLGVMFFPLTSSA